MKMSAIKFDIHKFDGVINFSHPYPEQVEESTTREGEKASRHEGRNLTGVG